MILKKLAFLTLLLMPVIPAHEEPISSQSNLGFLEPLNDRNYEEYIKYFNRFRQYYAPFIGDEQAFRLKTAIWYGSEGNINVAMYSTAMCVQESGLRIRKYQPKVHQATDYIGCHYPVLFAELHREGLFTGTIFDKKHHLDLTNPQVKMWYLYFKNNPDYGTLLGIKWYNHQFVKKYGLEKATRIWNQGDCFCANYYKPGVTEKQREAMIIRRDKSIHYLNNINAILANVNPNCEIVLANCKQSS